MGDDWEKNMREFVSDLKKEAYVPPPRQQAEVANISGKLSNCRLL
jgi:hypothetical protein